MQEERKEFSKWWLLVLGLVLASYPVTLGLKTMGVFGERVVFENSHQYHEAKKSEIATFEAQIAQIQTKLTDSDLDASTRNVLESQLSALQIQINAARSK